VACKEDETNHIGTTSFDVQVLYIFHTVCMFTFLAINSDYFLYTETFLILRRMERGMINVIFVSM
jgi:hypothetical protein